MVSVAIASQQLAGVDVAEGDELRLVLPVRLVIVDSLAARAISKLAGKPDETIHY